MASYVRPTLGTIIARVQGDLRSRETSSLLRRSVETVVGFVVAGVAHHVHGHLEWLRKQMRPVDGDVETVREWGEMIEVSEVAGGRGAGTVTFVAETDAVLDQYALLRADDGTLFETQAPADEAGGVLLTDVVAVNVGIAGNALAGATLTLVEPVAGLELAGTAVDDFTGGFEGERLESYRARVLDEVRDPSAGGGPGDYVRWGRTQTDVTRVWERPHRRGVGTVSVAFMCDGRANPFPLAGDVEDMQTLLDSKRPLDMRALYVTAPIPQFIALTIALTPNTAPVRAAVRAALDAFFRSEVDFEQSLAASNIDEVISLAAGETSHTIMSISSLTALPWRMLTINPAAVIFFGGA